MIRYSGSIYITDVTATTANFANEYQWELEYSEVELIEKEAITLRETINQVGTD